MGKPQRSKYSTNYTKVSQFITPVPYSCLAMDNSCPPARKKGGRASLVSFISFYLLGWNKTIQPPSQVPVKGMLICSGGLHEEVERRRTKEKH